MIKASVVLLLSVLLFSCSSTHQTGRAKPSGYLDSYDGFTEEKMAGIQAAFVQENADLSQYKKIVVKPFTYWSKEGANELSNEQKQIIAHAEKAFKAELAKSWTLVEQPTEGALMFNLVIIDADSSSPLRDLTSNLIPFSTALSTSKRLVTGKHMAVGYASIEFEALGAGLRLFAGYDERAGRKRLRGKFDVWEDLEDSFTEWAKIMTRHLKKHNFASK